MHYAWRMFVEQLCFVEGGYQVSHEDICQHGWASYIFHNAEHSTVLLHEFIVKWELTSTTSIFNIKIKLSVHNLNDLKITVESFFHVALS